MVDQATLEKLEQTQAASREVRSTPPSAVAKSASELIQDIMLLLELQLALFRTDAGQGVNRFLKSLVCFTTTVLFLLGCIPVLLLGVAYGLVELFDMSRAVAFSISTGIALVVAAAAGTAGWIFLRQTSSSFERSFNELSRNLSWIKIVLTRRQHATTAQ